MTYYCMAHKPSTPHPIAFAESRETTNALGALWRPYSSSVSVCWHLFAGGLLVSLLHVYTRTRESGVLPASTVSKRTSTVRTSAWDPAKNLRLAVPKRRNYLRTSGSASGVAVLNTRARLYGAARGVHARLCRIVPLYRPCSALCTLRLRRCLGSPKSCSGRSVIAWTTLQKLWTRSSAQPSCGAIGRSWSLSHHRRVHVHASPEVARR